MRRGKAWNVRVASALVAAACLLSACTGSTEAAPVSASPIVSATPPTAPPSPSPSPTPKPSPPKKPAGADEDSTAGAKKAIQYFFDVRMYAYETGETAPLTKMSHEECRYCGISVSEAKAHASAGERVDGPRMTVGTVEYVGMGEGVFPTYDVTLTQHPWKLYGRDGSLVDENPATRTIDGVMSLERHGTSWRVRALTVEKVSE